MQGFLQFVSLRAVAVSVHMYFVLLFYTSFREDKISIEAIIEAFALNYVVSHLVAEAIQKQPTLQTKHVVYGSCACVAASATMCFMISSDLVAEVVFGILCGVGLGGFMASEAVFTFHHKQEQERALVVSTLSVWVGYNLALSAKYLLLLPFMAFLILTLVAMKQYVIILDFEVPRSTYEQKQIYKESSIYKYTFPLVFMVTAYYDVIYLFLTIYTNHVQLPDHIATKEWFQKDSIVTVFFIDSIFLFLAVCGRLWFHFVGKYVSQTARAGLFYFATTVKLICVGLLPLSDISLYTIITASFCSGCTIGKFDLKGYSQALDWKIHKTASIALLLVLHLGRHVDNSMLTLTTAMIISFVGLVLLLVSGVLTLTDFQADTSFLRFLHLKANQSCLQIQMHVVSPATPSFHVTSHTSENI